MKSLLQTDPDRVLVENRIQGELIASPAVGEEYHLVHDIFYADSLRLYTDLGDPLGSLLELDKDYVLYKQDTIATDLSGYPCYRSLIFLSAHETLYADYQVYGDLLSAEIYNEISNDVEAVVSDLEAHAQAVGTAVHGATTSAAPGKILCRDGNAQAEVGSPTEANHIVRLLDLQAEEAARAAADTALADALAGEAVSRQDAIDEHTNAEGVLAHGATEELEPGAIICRDENGQAEVGAPTEANHMARLLDLQDLIEDIEDGTTVAGNANKLENKTLAEVLALAAGASISDLMPIGTILMYDANNPGGTGDFGESGPWVDDDTMPGWWACIPENADKGCPNMVDRFPMGKAVAGAGTSGGAASVTLTVGQLPLHNHSINHGHTASSGSENANHSHNGGAGSGVTGYVSHDHQHVAGVRSSNTGFNDFGTAGLASNRAYGNSSTDYSTGPYTSAASSNHYHVIGNQNSGHQHAITVADHTGNSGGTGSGDPIDIRNPYYSVVFVRKCA